MKAKFGEKLDVKIFTTDSEEARGYTFMGSTNVLINNEMVSLDVATDKTKMEAFLSHIIR
jgi:hypothetical protein